MATTNRDGEEKRGKEGKRVETTWEPHVNQVDLRDARRRGNDVENDIETACKSLVQRLGDSIAAATHLLHRTTNRATNQLGQFILQKQVRLKNMPIARRENTHIGNKHVWNKRVGKYARREICVSGNMEKCEANQRTLVNVRQFAPRLARIVTHGQLYKMISITQLKN